MLTVDELYRNLCTQEVPIVVQMLHESRSPSRSCHDCVQYSNQQTPSMYNSYYPFWPSLVSYIQL